ncbi:exodeoxyribonuclease V subunit beta [Candidatus Ishikawella capsulata]|uniref:RecBCD enzyme subunit RecB n=1 Tax=Candidatus Ishikawaella capsulata Mpkobe TaxID=476281 RepID=C5WCE0_9ENTR|nr:exodeoxyribonuclease V subunit beta [Candidatus Ishikawaella capsulata]BAH82996.1 RecBCD complex beta subunit [Candidatus Ishikawaella capsulata Mpkobe]
MDNLKIKSLNLLKLPLKGESLIEASAGTGKTFALVLLYLRLLLGLGEDGNPNRPLKVTEILVVTFTDNATSELRYRISKNIHALRMTCLNYENNVQFNDLVKQIPNREEANKLLFIAEQQIDEAAIFTIHSFCQRMLNLNAFESCVLFERKFIENDLFLLQQATADFWRKNCYHLKKDIASIILKEWNGPDALLKNILPYLHLRNKIPNIKVKDNEINDIQLHHICTINYIKIIKNQWIANYTEIENILFNLKIDKRSYNSRYLPLWINKITKWAKKETINYLYPKELKYFSQELITKKIKKGSIFSHSLFISIEKFLKKDLSIRDIFIKQALTYINKTLYKEKLLRSVISFDDLLILLDKALHKPHGEILADNIRQKYPIALIDEFQDTDQLQYRIFKKIYFNQKNYGLILIGDPKQAIYSFRGANIFTYILARNELKCYTLDTNWRSSTAMVLSVNQLFSRIECPFLFSVIPFRPVLSAEENKHLRFEINNELQPAIKYWLQPVKKTNVTDYQFYMAHQCAVNISQLLEGAKNGKVFIGQANNLHMLKASDITVLVRNHSEADIIINELNAINIPSAYFSNRNSVYNTHTARELLLLLQGILFLEQENIFRTALATSLLGFDSTVLDITNKNSPHWISLIEKFILWRDIWYKNGIFPMLRNIIKEQKLAETLLTLTNGNRYLINFMHLSELLQIASVNLDCPIKILRFLENQIQHPNEQDINQQVRLESDHNLIQIITIHKSKGLQYPLVWLPFAANFNKDLSINSKFIDDFSDQSINQKTLSLRDKELLSENLRLLYVALTRSIYHCSVGIAPLNHTIRKKTENTDFHKTAIGFLLQYGKTADDIKLKNYLYEMMENNKHIKVIENTVLVDKTICQNKTSADIPKLNFRHFTRDLTRISYINSYSSLHQNNNDITETRYNFEITNYKIKNFYISDNLTPHDFPKGSKTGNFLHNLLNSLEFNLFPEQSWLEKRLQESGYSADKWISVLESWIFNILNVSLGVDDIQLSKLESKNMLREMEFYIPIKNQITASSLNKLIQHYDPISRYAPSLNFKQIQGMLKGFIDLVFSWKGKYYIVDYKSNWLGDSEYNYTIETINQSMIDHRYDLQYQIYCLALHRYLKQRLRYYKYEYHFGGVFYLFLRGIVATIPKSGIFTTVPSYDFINSLDSLFLEDKSIYE